MLYSTELGILIDYSTILILKGVFVFLDEF